MIYLAIALSLGLFVWGLKRTRVVDAATSAILVAKEAMAILFDATLSDEEKERTARASSYKLAVGAVMVIARFALAAAAPLAVLGLLVGVRVISLASLADVLESWTFIAVWAVVVAAALFWRR